jgi:probable F420-dependent oxidoreductase
MRANPNKEAKRNDKRGERIVKIDGAIMVDDPRDAGPVAKGLEDAGYDGGFVFEGRHDPFLPIAVAAEHSERIELITAIAVAFARNPMNLANLGYDLQLHSKGRFILGLGSQIRPHIERRFSMPWSRPAARMREMVLAIRAIWDDWEGGDKLNFQGDFYNHTLMTPVFNPGPNPYGRPRIYLAGVGPFMTAVAGEVGDGYFLHPFHTAEFLDSVTLPALEKGLAKAGRSRDDFEISAQVIIAAGDNDEEIEAAKNMARAQISFYGSTPAYRGVLDCHGLGGLQEELKVLSKTGGWLEMAGKIDDALLERIAIVGKRDEIAGMIKARYGDWAHRVSLVSYAPKTDNWAGVVQQLRAAG